MCDTYTLEYSAIKKDKLLTEAYNMDGFQKHYTEQKKPEARLHSVQFHLYDMSRKGSSAETESRLVVPGAGDGGGLTEDGHNRSFGADENILKVVIVAQL